MRFLKNLLIFFATSIGIVAIGLWWFMAGPGYYAEFNKVKERLSSIPGIKILKAGGNEDITFREIYATVELNGIVITFQDLTKNSFDNPSSIIISQFGPYVPSTRGCIRSRTKGSGSPRFYGSSINIGQNGDFSRVFPNFRNVQDVLSRANELGDVLRSWPITPDKKYINGTRSIYTYWVQMYHTDGYEGPWMDLKSISQNGQSDLFEKMRNHLWEQVCTDTSRG